MPTARSKTAMVAIRASTHRLVNTDTDGGRGVSRGRARRSRSAHRSRRLVVQDPNLRNIKLTAPYFHHGAYPTLEDVIDFYDRGGDAPDNPQISANIKPRT